MQVFAEVSNLIANVPFDIIDDGPNGNGSHLVVSRPLLAGLYDVVITLFTATARDSDRGATSWYWVRVNGKHRRMCSYT